MWSLMRDRRPARAAQEELHQLSRGKRHAGRLNTGTSSRGRDVKGVDHAAVDLVGEHDRRDELRSARALAFSDREQAAM